MRLTLDIARRYLLGKKSTHAINIISWISILGIAIGTAALIIILSIFNGFEGLLSGLFSSFNPDIKVKVIDGKYFELSDDQMEELLEVEGIIAISKTVEEIAIFDYKDVQKAGIIKGVDDQYLKATAMDSTIRMGQYKTYENGINYGLLGRGLSINLGVSIYDKLTPITVYMPLRKKTSIINQLGKEFKTMSVYPNATFSAGSDVDVQYLISNFEFVNELLSQKDKISALEIRMEDGYNEKAVRASIHSILGEGYDIENRYQQDEEYLKIMNIERWISFLIATLILLIIAFNMVGSLWMMVLEKKRDISILQSMGFTRKKILSLFLVEGMLISLSGLVLGIILAIIFYILQINYGIVGVPTGFMIDAYPIQLKFTDFIIVVFTVMSIGFLASLLPSYHASKISSYVREE